MDKEMLSIGKEIRKRLGEDGYMLDNYLAMLLGSINGNTIQHATEDGEEVFTAAYHLCGQIHDEKDMTNDEIRKKRFYPQLKKYMDYYAAKHKSRYTVTALVCIATAPDILKKAYADALVTYSSRSWLDCVRLKELYIKISEYAGVKLMERITELIRLRLLISPALNAYMQAATNRYIDALLQRDEVSSKQLFQLILDDAAADSICESKGGENED